MTVISDFNVNLNKSQVINIVKSYFPYATEEELSCTFDNLLPSLEKNIQPIGVYKLEEKKHSINIDILKDYDYLVYCLITIGDDSTQITDALFAEGKFNEAILFDAMASSYLFQASSQLFNYIYADAKNLNLGLSCKIAPGDGEIDVLYQKEIVKKLENKNLHHIGLMNDFLLYPSKSMSYLYGADKKIAFNTKDHSCSNCNNKFCQIKNHTSGIKDAFN